MTHPAQTLVDRDTPKLPGLTPMETVHSKARDQMGLGLNCSRSSMKN